MTENLKYYIESADKTVDVVDMYVYDDEYVCVLYRKDNQLTGDYISLSEADNLSKMDKDEIVEILLENYDDMFTIE